MAQGEVMRFLGWLSIVGFTCVVSSFTHASVEGYSKVFSQCMGATYGGSTQLQEKCIKTELKNQKKRLKANYKKYLKAHGQSKAMLKVQHAKWEALVEQQCERGPLQHDKMQQGQCVLGMVISQANFYGMRTKHL